MTLSDESKRLEKALFQSGNNNHIIIDMLTQMGRKHRTSLAKAYEEISNRNLIEDFHNELGGLFEDACVALLKPYHELNADIVHQTLMGDKFSFLPIIDVFFTNDQQELQAIKETFAKKYGEDMTEYLSYIKDDNILEIALKIFETKRDSSDNVDLYLAYEEVDQLNEAGLGLSWARQNEFLQLLCSRNFDQLQLTMKIYERVTGNCLQDDIRRYFDGDLHDIFSAIVTCVRCPVDYFAERIHECLKGSKNDRTIINILVSRSERDLNDIQRRYKTLFRKALRDEIRLSMRGDFRRLLLALLRVNEDQA